MFGNHNSDHGVSDACHHAVDNYNHSMHTFADNVGHFFNNISDGAHSIFGHPSTHVDSPSSFGDVARSGIDAYGASDQMHTLCGSGGGE